MPFLRGGAGCLRHGNSAPGFDRIGTYTPARLALFVARRHRRRRSYGWLMVASGSPNRMGLVNLKGCVVAPRPNQPGREKPHAVGEGRR